MILRRLRLRPFGCFADREVRFERGLNVVVGANEAGKSTIFHAARTALLRTRMDKRKIAELVSRFYPAGGDTVRLEAEIETDRGVATIRRQWGSATTAEVELPGGALASGSDAVSAALDDLLPVGQSALWHVLFTSQTELAQAVDGLRSKAGDAIHDLSDTLRRALLGAGGTSPERFRELLDKRIAELLDNWEMERGCPRSNRGIDNPWVQRVGQVLEDRKSVV